MNINDLMKQAQQMQEKMTNLQQEASSLEVTGESGAGLIKVTMTGRYDVRKVDIDPSVLTEDKEFLEDWVANKKQRTNNPFVRRRRKKPRPAPPMR